MPRRPPCLLHGGRLDIGGTLACRGHSIEADPVSLGMVWILGGTACARTFARHANGQMPGCFAPWGRLAEPAACAAPTSAAAALWALIRPRTWSICHRSFSARQIGRAHV